MDVYAWRGTYTCYIFTWYSWKSIHRRCWSGEQITPRHHSTRNWTILKWHCTTGRDAGPESNQPHLAGDWGIMIPWAVAEPLVSLYIYISNKNLGDPGSKDPKIVVSNFFWGSNDPKDYCVNFFWDQTIQRSLCPIFFGDQKRSKSLLCPIFLGGSKDPKIIVSNFCGSKDPKIFLCIPFFWGASLWTLSACWLPKPLVATFQEYGMLLELYRGLRQAICFYGCDLFDLSRDFSLDHMGLGFRQICYFKSQGPKSIQKLKAVKISSSLRFLWDVFFSCPASHCHLCHRIWSAPYGWCQISTLMSFEVGFPKCLRPCFGTSVGILGGLIFSIEKSLYTG